ncbi:spectrin beta chain [Anaeramoeba flamelloides]|uniref:Spectrin beta chain n=1 Tax=Anaeramoeba flamelloides TaxID=1746091 RepID=A0ABQ8XW76_9EUKA|nr:spectrin beta chain [Anaeramoeba flamelloides]
MQDSHACLVQQEKAFIRWCNLRLEKVDLKIQKLSELFKNCLCVDLLQVLVDHKFQRFIQPLYQGSHLFEHAAVWYTIRIFEINKIAFEGLTGEKALLLWCQRATSGYDNVDIVDFTCSWQNGLGFCALIHNHNPDLIEYKVLDGKNIEDNLNKAYGIAENVFGIPKLLDAEDQIKYIHDKNSTIMYLFGFFRVFYTEKMEKGKPADTLEQTLEEWKTIANGKKYVTKKDMEIYKMSLEDIEFFISKMPVLETGYDYNIFFKKTFSEK